MTTAPVALAPTEAAPDVPERPAGRPPARLVPTLAALGAFTVLLVVARVWGDQITESGRRILLASAPLTGHDVWRVGWRALGALAVAVLAVAFGPGLARRLPWRALLAAAVALTAVWALSLALVEGWSGVTDPVVTPTQYLHDVPAVGSPGGFLDGFTERVDEYHAHVRAHPPGMVLTLWALDRAGLGGPGWTAALLIAGGAAAVAAVLLGVREVAGEAVARRAAPFVALAPAALWVATTYDAFFAGVGAWGVALVILATGRRDRTGDAQALAGGLLLGATVMLSYGLVLLGAVPLAVAVSRRRVRPLLVAAGAAVALVLAFVPFGFWWFDGLSVATREYGESIARTRPYGYFLLANVAALAVALGPALAVAFTRLRGHALAVLVVGALAAVVVADVSGMSKGEVERIWLPFTVWLLPAAAVLGRPWLAANAGFALLVQLRVHTVW